MITTRQRETDKIQNISKFTAVMMGQVSSTLLQHCKIAIKAHSGKAWQAITTHDLERLEGFLF